MDNNKNSTQFNNIAYFVVIALSLVFLFVGNRVATRNLIDFNNESQLIVAEAIVTDIVDVLEERHEISSDFIISNKDIIFNAKITRGYYKNEEIQAVQSISTFFVSNEREVQQGDRVVLSFNDINNQWHFIEYVRIYQVLVLGVLFIILILVFGRKKGFNSIISLLFTFMAIFYVFIPALLAGKNIYIASIIVCVFSIISTLLIVVGINKKSVSSILGCLGSIFIISILTFFMDSVLMLTGLVNQEAQLLLFLPTKEPIDLRAIIFASIIIGAVGAIMDVAMSISSSLWEVKLKSHGEKTNFKSIFESGINIGKDILGTMMNTLILAYIGSSLSILLLIRVNATPLIEVLNMEMVIVELLRMIIGSLGIFLTIPLTSAICGFLYSKESLYGEEGV